MQFERKVKLLNPDGLHVRVAVKLVEEARKFRSEISLTKDQVTVKAKDIMSVLTLGAAEGTDLILRAEGEDASDAIQALARLFESQFQD